MEVIICMVTKQIFQQLHEINKYSWISTDYFVLTIRLIILLLVKMAKGALNIVIQ